MLKAVVSAILNMLSGYGHKDPFIDFINNAINDIASMRVGYCMMKELPIKQWVSEHCLALARVFLYVFGHYTKRFGPSANSNRREDWKRDVTCLQQMVNSFHVMAASLMSRDNVEVNVIERNIKIFLSCCKEFGSTVLKNPFWETKVRLRCHVMVFNVIN